MSRADEDFGKGNVRLGAREVRPDAGGPLGCRRDPGLLQDLPDCGRGHLDAEDERLTVKGAVSPPRILGGQARYQGADGAYGARSALGRTWRSSSGTAPAGSTRWA
jgi:hypothetical protein